MLRSAGFDANPVLVSTRNHGVPLFPTLKGFNYVITAVEFSNGSYILLDATELYSLPNVLPTRVLNWKGRLIKKDGSSYFIGLAPKKHSTEDSYINAQINNDGIVKGVMSVKLTNQNALNFRKRTNALKEEDVISKLEEKYLIEIKNFKVTNKRFLEKPINQRLKFTSDNLVERINGKLYIAPLLFLTKTKNPFKLENRKFPVDFERPWREKKTIVLQVPEGFQVESFPESMAIGLPDNLGVFKFQIKVIGSQINIISLMQINNGIIGQEYYQYLKEFYKKMIKKQSEKIVLIKK